MRSLDKFAKGHFVAWDSEGVTLDSHVTVCLGNSDSQVLQDATGLRTREMLDFTVNEMQRAGRSAIHVAFAYGYDVNMILRDLSRPLIQQLWTTTRTTLHTLTHDYELHYVPRKVFGVWRRSHKGGQKLGGYLWDTFGFFQSSFVKACKSYGELETLERIERMKKERRNFTPDMLPEIVEYMLDECRTLVRIMDKLRYYLKEADLRVNRWDGAGAVAASLLARENVKVYMQPLQPRIERVAQHAYFGGRVEMLRYGFSRDTIYEADVRSAYPASAMQLPCLTCGSWRRYPNTGYYDAAQPILPDRALAAVRVDFDFPPEIMYPFPWRDDKTGNIYFPPTGSGWYWWPEVRTAMQHFPGCVKVRAYWLYETSCNHNPFEFIPRVYNQRIAWKLAGNGAEKAAKLGINACYGKLAQRVSAYGRPAFQNLAWAGWITSLLRARMFAAAWPVRASVIMIGTDSIYADTPLDHLPESETIGDWEHARYSGIVSVQAGFYWLWDYEKTDEIAKRRTRGFHGKIDERCTHDNGVCACDPLRIAEAWRSAAKTYKAKETVFIGMGQALAGDSIWSHWREWYERDREIDLFPTGKREPDYNNYRGAHKALKPTNAVQPIYAMARQDNMSAPIELENVTRDIPIDQRAEHELERK